MEGMIFAVKYINLWYCDCVKDLLNTRIVPMHRK